VKALMHRFMALTVVVLGFLILAGCSKPPVDPVEQANALIPKIADGLNRRDIGALKDLGTDRFEPNRFLADVFSHGVKGDVTLSLYRFRQVPGETKLVLTATFGVGEIGGRKELTLTLAGDKVLKVDLYSLTDVRIPPAEPNTGTAGSPGL